MVFAANDSPSKRAGGLLGGLFGGGDDDDKTSSAAAATPPAASNTPGGGLLGPGGGLGPVTPSSTPASTSSASTATESSSATPSSTPSATAASSTALSSSSSTDSSLSSTVSASSAPLSTTSILSTPISSPASSTPAPAPSIYVTTEGSGGVVTITSRIPAAAAATGAPSTTPAAAGFLQNKGAMAGTFTVVGIIALILVFVASTWCIRRNKRNRLLEEAVDWSPSTHLTAPDTEKGYPASLHRTNSGTSTVSRPGARYPAPSTYRDQPPLPSQVVYGNMSASGAGAAYPGYYDKPVPAPPAQYMQYAAPSQQMQQAYAGADYGAYGAYGAADYQQQHQYQNYAPAPPASLQPAQNPAAYNGSPSALAPPAAPFNRAHARTPSPTDSDMAYLGYVNDPGAPVQVVRKVSLSKATATAVKHAPGSARSVESATTLGGGGASPELEPKELGLKVVNE